MELNRYHYYMLGLFLLLLGLELRTIEAVVLTPEVTKFLAERTGHPVATASNAVAAVTGTSPPIPPKTIRPPEWLGYAVLSAGSVLVLYSLALPKPGG
ncbi:MAG: hypothetical protein WBH86_12855 [Thermogutta sp.]|nr:hypothetical protein [Thermogutta sp.]HOP77396.1 hypothetical protein [Thermogutta sp.]HPU04937.1 hypothetical protein [Thermogutta sp.]HPZ84266.1 hypothetical protein [Thermogutta sp.]HQF15040.1 hypothetical protein [Thermogutta sp.]